MEHTIQELLVSCQQVNLFEATRKTCNHKTMTIDERIKQARESAGYSQKTLAERLKVSQQAVHQWEKPNGTKPKAEVLNKLASLLGVSAEWILNGNEEVENLPYTLVPRCPLIKWEDVSKWPSNKNQLKEDKEGIKYPGNQLILNDNCYMLQIEDDSMVSKMEAKGYYPNKYIVVDPSKTPENGNLVIANSSDLLKPIFMEYINNGKKKYLTPWNLGRYERLDLTDDIEICGVVVAYLDLLL